MKIIIFAMLNLMSLKVFAQDNKASYEKDLGYLGCRLTEYTLHGDRKDEFQRSFPCNEIVDFAGIMAFLKENNLDVNTQLLIEVEHLKLEFKEGWKPDDISPFLTERIFQNPGKYQKLEAFYRRHNNEKDFPGLIQTLKAKFSTEGPIVPHDNGGKPPVEKVSAAADTGGAAVIAPRTTVAHEEGEKSWFGGVKFELDVFSILFTLGMGVLLVTGKSNKKSDEIPEKFRNYVHEKLTRSNADLAGRGLTEKLEKDLRDLVKVVDEQRRQLRDLAMTNTILGKIQEDRTWSAEPASAIEKKEAANDIIYLPTPSEDRSFDNSFASPVYREGTSIYKVFKKAGNRATFQIDEHETAIRLALQYAELRIEPCCIPLNAYNPDSRRIELAKPGELELKENRWVILSKMEIRYEN